MWEMSGLFVLFKMMIWSFCGTRRLEFLYLTPFFSLMLDIVGNLLYFLGYKHMGC